MDRYVSCAERPNNIGQECQILWVASECLRLGRQVWIDVAAGRLLEIFARLLGRHLSKVEDAHVVATDQIDLGRNQTSVVGVPVKESVKQPRISGVRQLVQRIYEDQETTLVNEGVEI